MRHLAVNKRCYSQQRYQRYKKLAKRYMDEPQMIQVQSEEVTVDTIEQRVIETTDRAKPDALRFVMDRDQPF